jgi:DNA polymerase/3'-5' exonuclease PolX
MQLKADGSGIISPGGELMRMESEEQIFETLKLPYKRPEERE